MSHLRNEWCGGKQVLPPCANNGLSQLLSWSCRLEALFGNPVGSEAGVEEIKKAHRARDAAWQQCSWACHSILVPHMFMRTCATPNVNQAVFLGGKHQQVSLTRDPHEAEQESQPIPDSD